MWLILYWLSIIKLLGLNLKKKKELLNMKINSPLEFIPKYNTGL